MTNDRKKKAVLKLVNTALVYALLADVYKRQVRWGRQRAASW